jgi:hypothetical protein
MTSLKGGEQRDLVGIAFKKPKPTGLCRIAAVRRKISVKMCVAAKSKHLYVCEQNLLRNRSFGNNSTSSNTESLQKKKTNKIVQDRRS